MRRACLSLLLVLGFVLVTDEVAAQQQYETLEKGFQPEKLYHFGDIDHVNVFNGDLIIALPIGLTYPLNGGLTYNFVLSYNSKVWDLWPGPGTTTHTRPASRSNAGIGWLFGLGRYVPVGDPTNLSGTYIYEAPDGGDHRFGEAASLNMRNDACTPGSNCYYTVDGSNLRLRILSDTVHEIDFPDGVTKQFQKNGSVWDLRQIRNSLGSDTVSITPANGTIAQCPGSNSYWTVSDSRGRTDYVCFKNWPVDTVARPMVDRVVLTPVQGAAATYTFSYVNRTVPKGDEDTDNDSGSWPQTHNIPQLTAVRLSTDSSTFAMDYLYRGIPPHYVAQLKTLTLPTQGKIDYTYGTYLLPAVEDVCANYNGFSYGFAAKSVGVVQRTLTSVRADGQSPDTQTWTYSLPVFLPSSPYKSVTNCTPATPEDPNATPTYVNLYDEMVMRVFDPTGDYVENHFSVWPGNDVGRLPDPNTSPAGVQRQNFGLPYGPYDATQNRFLSQEFFHCNGSNCNPVRSLWVRHDIDGADGTTPQLPHRLASQRTVFRDDPSGCVGDGASANCHWTATDSSNFDTYGHYRTATNSANFGNGGDLRTVTTSWNLDGSSTHLFALGDKWILNTYDDVRTTDNGQTAIQQACFDRSTGFLSAKRSLLGSTPGGTDLLAVYQKDTDGNLSVESYYGGDPDPINAHPPITNDARLCDAVTSLGNTAPTYQITHGPWQYGQTTTSQYANATFLSLNLTIDPSGLISSSRDTSGLLTSYSYDSAGRLSTIAPPGVATTSINYTTASNNNGTLQPATAESITSSAQSAGMIHRQYQYDSFGRLWREKQLMPDNSWSVRETLYDGKDRKASKSELQQLPADPAAEFTFAPSHLTHFAYDTFDRTTAITTPDSKTTAMNYAGIRSMTRTTSVATGTSETNVSTTEVYDGQGRLLSVTEADGTQGSVTTTYGYDVGGRLASVAMPGENGTQTRTFQYDNRGLLTSEQHPELGSTGNGTVSYFEYDARGHAHRKTAGMPGGAFDVRTAFDSSERPTTVTDVSLNRLLKQFFYDSGYNCTGTLCQGRLAAGVRNNYDPDLGNVTATDQYQYDSATGRPARRERSVTSAGSFTGDSFFFSQTYNDLGLISTLTYPCRTIDHQNCNPADRIPRVVTNGYINGLLSSVNPWATSITYQPNGVINTISHGSGVSETWTPDPNGMPRPCSIVAYGSGVSLANNPSDPCGQTLTGNGAQWTTGDYAYDGAGNIRQIGPTAYTYDPFGRLVAWITSPQPGSFSSTQLGFDTFGNRKYEVDSYCSTDSNGAVHCLTVDPALRMITGTTNHYWDSTYDDAGDVTSDGSRTMHYDPLSMTTSVTSGGRDFRFFYTADDERIAAVEMSAGAPIRTTWTVRGFGNQVLSEWTNTPANGTLWKEDEIWRGTSLLANETSAPASRHYHLDHLGSPRFLTDANGQMIGNQDFDPFGGGGTANGGALQFTGHERDSANLGGGTVDLPDYMHARYYTPGVGRFMSLDSGKTTPKFPQSWNKYAYVRNNPLRFTDPTGNDLFIVFDFSDSHLSTKQQTIVMNAIRQRFLNAGVKVVNAYIDGSSVIPKATKSTDMVVKLTVTSKSLDDHGRPAYGVTPGIFGIPGTHGNASTQHAPRTNPGFMNFLVNVGTHEVGHGSQALPQYNWDALKSSAVPGSIMETSIKPDVVGDHVREFSGEDAASLRLALNPPEGQP